MSCPGAGPLDVGFELTMPEVALRAHADAGAIAANRRTLGMRSWTTELLLAHVAAGAAAATELVARHGADDGTLLLQMSKPELLVADLEDRLHILERAADAAKHALASVLADRTAISDDLLERVIGTLDEALAPPVLSKAAAAAEDARRVVDLAEALRKQRQVCDRIEAACAAKALIPAEPQP